MRTPNSWNRSPKRLKKQFPLFISILLALVFCLNGTMTLAQAPGGNYIAVVTADATAIRWQPAVDHAGLTLTISGPGGLILQQEFGPGSTPAFAAASPDRQPYPDGSYTYELRAAPVIDAETRTALEAAREAGNSDAVTEQLRQAGKLPEAMVQSGYFAIVDGSIVAGDVSEPKAPDLPGDTKSDDAAVAPADVDGGIVTPLDVVHYDDVIVDGSLCVGFDCVNGESFGYDTVRLKENNLRIKFQDTSSSASFPTNDWEITINDSANGGASYFGILDVDGGRWPFKVEAGAPSNALYVEDYGRVGLGTSTPVVELHIKDSDTPTVRLEQDGSSGWTPQTWDVAGNESNFFIRDATNGSKLPFRIQHGAPSNSLTIKSNGNVGIGTWSPTGLLHLYGTTEAFMKFESSTGYAAEFRQGGGYFHVRGTSGQNIAFNHGSGFTGDFQYYGGGTTALVHFDNGGNVGIGTTSPSYLLEVDGSAGKPGGGSWSDSSDMRLKENINAIDGKEALELLGQLQGVTFEWINPGEHSSGTQASLLAQDLEKVFPGWVEEYEAQGNDAALIPEGEKAKAIHFPHDFNAYVIEAVKALDAENRALQQQNADLEARLSALEKAAGAANSPTGGLPLSGLFLGSLVVAGLVVNRYRKQ